jgi:pyrroline-5-carboxylate reductase
MGGALLDGWLDRGTSPSDIVVVEPSPEARLARPHVKVVAGFDEISPGFRPDVVVLAVKPQMMDGALPPYAAFSDTLFLSFAAGKPLAYYARVLGAGTAVVRAMPNTPAAVRRGMTVAVAGPGVSAAQREICDELLSAVGEVAWIADEPLIDVVTALSGGGPAYVFLLVETLAAAGVAAGLPADLAARLARVTVEGSGELLHQSPEEPAVLRRNVTSPGGTTLAALQVLMGDEGLEPLMVRAIAAAAHRSRELAG